VGGLYGLLAGWWTPRGPVTTAQALAAMGLGLAVGLTSGLVSRTRWAALVAPTAFVGVFELSRIGSTGPMVDGIHLGSQYGILAFALGRGLHGVLAILPMILGVVLGAGLARRARVDRPAARGRSRTGLWTRRTVTAMSTLGLLGLAGALVRPARTAAIRGADGAPLPGSVAELTRVKINGHSLAMMIRGASIANPVLLFLAGGPGGTEIGSMRRHGRALEQSFVVATFDQRGTGKSYDSLDPVSTLTLDGAVADAIAVTRYLCRRFGQQKVYLVGNSWGTMLGVLAAQQHPELFHAFVGTGQMVCPRETDRVFYTATLAWARRTHDTALVDKLTRNGPPPYTDMLRYETALTHEPDVYPYDHSRNSEGVGAMGENLFVQESSLLEQLHDFPAVLDVFTVLYPQLQHIDFRTQVRRLDVPVYLVEGRYEPRGRARAAREWFSQLRAPTKQLIVFATSGHRPVFEQPREFAQVMTTTVLAAAAERTSVA